MIGMITVSAICATLLASQFDGPVSLDIQRSGQTEGQVSNVLNVHTYSDWTAAFIVVELEAGAILQDATYVADGPEDKDKPFLSKTAIVTGPEGYGKPIYVAGASDHKYGGKRLQMDHQRMDICWYNLSTDDIGWGRIGKLTFTDDAVGHWVLAVGQAGDRQQYMFGGKIVLGELVKDNWPD